MQANATKSTDKIEFPMYGVSDKISEQILALMQAFGIQRIECRRLVSVNYERLMSEIDNFPGTPPDIVNASILVKDHIAAIMASTGILSLKIEAEEPEIKSLTDSYKMLSDMARENREKKLSANAGSANIDDKN